MPRRKSSPPHIVVLGGANTDFLVRAAHLPQPGECVTGTEFDHAAAGGKGANQAVAAARLGARVTFLGRVGADDRGRALLRRLKAEGVNVQHVIRDPRAPTGVALISVDATGEKQIAVAPGANQRLTATDIHRPAIARAIQQADILILQFEVPMSANLAAARLAHQAGVPIVLDPAPALDHLSPLRHGPLAGPRVAKPRMPSAIAHLQSALLRIVTVLRANEHEAEALTGIRVANRQTAQKAAEHLLNEYPHLRAAILSAGQGNLAVWRSGPSINYQPSIVPTAPRTFAPVAPWTSRRASNINFVFVPRLPVNAIDATGAGDAFAAALAVALAEGHPIPTAAPFANAAAALATTKLGAQEALPQRATVLALLRRAGRKQEAKALSA